MKLLLTGWRRCVLPHWLIDRDISEVQASDHCRYSPCEVCIETAAASPKHLEPGELDIVGVATNVRLNGSFTVRLKLSKDEIVSLAAIALCNDLFPDVVEAISKKRPAR
jgi:hypothetical protein